MKNNGLEPWVTKASDTLADIKTQDPETKSALAALQNDLSLLGQEQKKHLLQYVDHEQKIKSLRKAIIDAKDQKTLEPLNNTVKELEQSLQTWGGWANPALAALPVKLKAVQSAYQKQKQTLTATLLIMPGLQTTFMSVLTEIDQRLGQLLQLETGFIEAQATQKQQEQQAFRVLKNEWQIAQSEYEERLAPFVVSPLAQWISVTAAAAKEFKTYDPATEERQQFSAKPSLDVSD